MTKVCIGVDGGGTKTRVFVVDKETKKVLGEAVVGGTNHNSVGEEAAGKQLNLGLTEALQQAKAAAADVAAIAMCMSGINTKKDIDVMSSWINTTTYPNARVFVYNDAVAGLACGSEGTLHGIVIVSGTGMIALGQNTKASSTSSSSSGENKQADKYASLTAFKTTGGYGGFVDDGSGYSIGCAVIKAAIHAFDGIAPATSLREAVLEHLKLTSYDDIIGWMYTDKENLGWAKFAAVAPLAFQESAKGDAVATKIVENAATGLTFCCKSLASKLSFTNESIPVVFIGGILQNTSLGTIVEKNIKTFLPNASVVRPSSEPAFGAALIACNNA